MIRPLDTQIALITGAADGIGAAIAARFAEAGADLVLLDVQAEANAALAQTLAARHGVRTLPLTADVSSSDAVNAAVEEAFRAFDRVDILVNNAAVAISGDPASMPDADWDRVISTNLSSAFRLIRAVLPGMKERQAGCILNIASTQAHRSWENWTAYAAAKGGLLAMTTQLAGQLGPFNIRVNAISPGAIDTPMNERRVAAEGEQLREEWARMHALGRTGTPREVADAALFLCSPSASFITGHDLKVEGGLCCLPRV
ncbi:MAG: SDR family oxidoreductase [Verrucomicrobia bacterium]|nr:SDR family oxidoreductase [Verrucomicrobiota bacterium]MCH8526195.1 SDR family oxidoreductase [Kiritimatiellia bacterium]